jgi:hypothetical protein
VTRKEKEENGLREGCYRLLNKRVYQKQKWKEITAVSKTGQVFLLKKPKNQRKQNKNSRNEVAIGAPEKLASSSASSTQLTCW